MQCITLPICVHRPVCKPTHILQAHLALLSMACNLLWRQISLQNLQQPVCIIGPYRTKTKALFPFCLITYKFIVCQPWVFRFEIPWRSLLGGAQLITAPLRYAGYLPPLISRRTFVYLALRTPAQRKAAKR